MKSLVTISNEWRDWVRARSKAGDFHLQDEISKDVKWLIHVRPSEEMLRARLRKADVLSEQMKSAADKYWVERLDFIRWVLEG